MHATDIAAYTYRADIYHPYCIIQQYMDSMVLPPGSHMKSTEDTLNELALDMGIDRMDEYSFDSDEFPKVVFVSQIEDPAEACGYCFDPLLD